MSVYTDRISRAEEVCWINPNLIPAGEALEQIEFTAADIEDAAARLERFAPVIMHYFPETVPDRGIIESPLTEIPSMRTYLNEEGAELAGRLFLKRDSDLKVSGSVKARGGVYEVLKHTEDLAIEAGILTGYDDDYLKLCTEEARKYFSQFKVQVGSTGNLGLSIGIMSATIGYDAYVHMSMDAKQWKKDELRRRGATVIEYEGDYGAAVAQGRKESDADPMSYFVDDENSAALFLGYAVAAGRMDRQLRKQGIVIDDDHPLFVYIPCGVGGAPGGVTFGLKLLYGDNAHVFFAEPTQCPCMLVGLDSGKMSDICVQDVGLTGKTEADGLACARPSGLVCKYMNTLLSGEFTVDDWRLNVFLRKLYGCEGLFIEPSSCAAFIAPLRISTDPACREYIKKHGLEDKMTNAIHVSWATGGSMVPQPIRDQLLGSGEDASDAAPEDELMEKCALFVRNRDALRKAFKWEGDIMLLLASMLLAAEDRDADTDRLKELEKMLRSRTGVFSPLRGNLKMIMLCNLLKSKDPEAFFDDTERAYSLIRISRGFRDERFYLAAMILSRAVTDKEQLLGLVDKSDEIYKKMREADIRFADASGYATAAAIALSGADVDRILDDACKCCAALEREFGRAPSFGALALMLGLDKSAPEFKCVRFREIAALLAKKGMDWTGSAGLPILGALARTDLTNAEIVDKVVEADDYLMSQKGFGIFGSGSDRRHMYAAMLVLSAVTPELDAGDAASASAVEEIIKLNYKSMTMDSLMLTANMNMMIRGDIMKEAANAAGKTNR